MKILKRNGSLEDVKLEKITKSIAKICSHIKNFDPNLIAIKTVGGIYDGVPSKELDLLSIKYANEMSIEDPMYGDVAAALMANYIRKEVRQQGIDTFFDSITQSYNNGLVNEYTYNLVRDNQDAFNNAIDYDKDRILAYFGLQVLYDRYLLKNPTSRKILENPQFMFLRVAAGLSHNAEEAIEFANVLSNTDYMTSTPTLFNSGTLHTQMSSCYVPDSPDDSISSIYEMYKDVAAMSKFAGGVGLSVSRIRSDGSLIKGTNGLSNGIVPWLHTLSSSIAAVNQGGKRKGAAVAYLEPWHADIMDFLDLRKNTGDPEKRAYNLNLATWNPDLLYERAKTNEMWSLFDPADVPDLTDLFGEEFEKRYVEYEAMGLAKEQVPARTIFQRNMTTLGETGNGWVCFKDRMNERCNTAVTYPDRYVLITNEGVSDSIEPDTLMETNRGLVDISDLASGDQLLVWGRQCTIKEIVFVSEGKGMIHSSNLCTEIAEANSTGTPTYMTMEELSSYSEIAREVMGMKIYEFDTRKNKFLVYIGAETSVCNLGSINLGSKNYVTIIDGKPEFNYELLRKVVPVAVKFLDRVVDINFYPIIQAKVSNSRFRPIGLGVMGLQDLFYRLRLPFASKEAIELSTKIQEEIYYLAIKQSCELAKEYGAHRDFRFTHAGNGKLQFDLAGVSRDNDERWVELKKEIAVHGLRNAHVIAIAPTACQVGTNEIITDTGVKSIYQILEDNQVNYLGMEESNIQQAIELKPFTVPTKFGDQSVSKIWFNGNMDVYRVTYVDGTSYEYTANHRLMLRIGENASTWENVGEIKQGDIIETNDSVGLEIESVLHIGVKPTWDIEVDNVHHYTMANGTFSHNTIATICGVEECIEPTKRNLFKRETLSGDFISYNRFLIEDLKKIDRWNETTKNQLIASDGSVMSIPNLPDSMYELYKNAWEHSQKVIIDHAAARSPFVDQAQSTNLFVDLNKYDAERRIGVLSSMYMYGYEKKLKTTYYLRSTSATKIQKVTVDSNAVLSQMTAPSDPDMCESCQ